MVKTLALVLGVIFVLAGLLGFVAAPDGMLLGVLHVNGLHNIIHLLTGLIAIICGMMGEGASRSFFKVFGVIYVIVAILGFFSGEAILGMVANNMADAIFHAIVALVFLFLGFGGGRR